MRLFVSKIFALMLILSALGAGAGQRLAADDHASGYTGLYDRISRAVVGITRSDYPRERSRSSITHFGTGTLLDPVGMVLTSPSVVPEGSRNIDVYLHGGRVAPAVLIKVYPSKEVSLLQLKDFRRALPPGKERLEYLRLGSSADLSIGDPLFSLGNAFRSIQSDDQVVMAAGVLSGIVELKEKHLESIYTGRALESTAALNNGMDGGPLVDARGRMVGLLILNFSQERWLGTAIPIDELKQLIEPHRSWFDDSLESASSLAGLELMNSHEGGKITVLRVSPGGAAASAGLRRGDVLRKFNGRKIESVPDFRKVFNAARPGEQVRLEVGRDKTTLSIGLTLWGRF